MRYVMAFVMVFGIGLVGCGGGTGCESRCEQGKDMGCVSPSTDCAAQCSTADEMEAAARSQAQTAGCEAEFNASIDCAEALEACESGCTAEGMAYASCLATFCAANPTSPACT